MTSFEMESELRVCVDHYQEFAVYCSYYQENTQMAVINETCKQGRFVTSDLGQRILFSYIQKSLENEMQEIMVSTKYQLESLK